MTTPAETIAAAITTHAIATRTGLERIADAIAGHTPDDPEPPEGLAVDQDVARPESAPVAGPYPPVRTAQELDTLPLWSAVRDADGDLWLKTPDGWQRCGMPLTFDLLDAAVEWSLIFQYGPLGLEHRPPAEDEIVVRIPDEIAERIANDQGMWVPEPWLRAIGDAIKAKDARRG